MARQNVVERLLLRRRQTRPVIRAVPTIVRRVASFLGKLVKRIARGVGSVVRPRG